MQNNKILKNIILISCLQSHILKKTLKYIEDWFELVIFKSNKAIISFLVPKVAVSQSRSSAYSFSHFNYNEEQCESCEKE